MRGFPTYDGLAWNRRCLSSTHGGQLVHVAFVTIYDPFCVGVRSIASYLKQAGHDVSITHVKWFDTQFVPRDDLATRQNPDYEKVRLVRRAEFGGDLFCPFPRPVTTGEKELFIEHLKTFKPDMFGLTLTSLYLDLAISLTALLREHFPGVPIVWGGIHPTLCPEECLQYADVICIGEGEDAMLELVQDPSRGDIQNLWRKNLDGSIVKTSMRPLIQDLDRLPFPLYGYNEVTIDWDKADSALTDNKEIIRIHQILQTTRGCPFTCTYCIHGTLRPRFKGQKYHRRRSVENVLDYIEDTVRVSDMDRLCFWDDVFLMGNRWIDEFAEKYPARFNFPFGGYGHPLFTPQEMMEKLLKIGLYFVAIGIQTGSERVNRDIYNRRIPNEKIRSLAWSAKNIGIDELVYDLLSNNPYETEQDCRETLDLLLSMPKPSKLTVSKLVMFPQNRILELTVPKVNLPERVFDFWNLLYLMSASPLFSMEQVRQWSQVPELRTNPSILESMVTELHRTSEENKQMASTLDAERAEVEQLRSQLDDCRQWKDRSLFERAIRKVIRTIKG